MEKDFSVIDYEVQDNVAVIVVNNPPVNALSFSVRAGLLHFLMKTTNLNYILFVKVKIKQKWQ